MSTKITRNHIRARSLIGVTGHRYSVETQSKDGSYTKALGTDSIRLAVQHANHLVQRYNVRIVDEHK